MEDIFVMNVLFWRPPSSRMISTLCIRAIRVNGELGRMNGRMRQTREKLFLRNKISDKKRQKQKTDKQTKTEKWIELEGA